MRAVATACENGQRSVALEMSTATGRASLEGDVHVQQQELRAFGVFRDDRPQHAATTRRQAAEVLATRSVNYASGNFREPCEANFRV